MFSRINTGTPHLKRAITVSWQLPRLELLMAKSNCLSWLKCELNLLLEIRFALVENTKGETDDISLYLPAPRKFVCPNLQCIYVKVVSPRFCTAFWLKVAKLSLTIREYQISKHFWLCRLQKWDSAWILKMGFSVDFKTGFSVYFDNGNKCKFESGNQPGF